MQAKNAEALKLSLRWSERRWAGTKRSAAFVFRSHQVPVEGGSGSRGCNVLQNRKKYGPNHDVGRSTQIVCFNVFLRRNAIPLPHRRHWCTLPNHTIITERSDHETDRGPTGVGVGDLRNDRDQPADAARLAARSGAELAYVPRTHQTRVPGHPLVRGRYRGVGTEGRF